MPGEIGPDIPEASTHTTVAEPPIALPEPHLVAELERFLRSLDMPDEGARHYLNEHLSRLVRTLSVTPLPGETGRVLELGAYMHMTPALARVLGYREVSAAYFGKLGKVEKKKVKVEGKVVFECRLHQFNAEKDKFPYRDRHFDTVLACEIFEHLLHDPMHMLFECRRVLVDGGTLVLTTPNITSYTAVARVLEQTNGNPQLYSKYTDPRSKHAASELTHIREYTPDELRAALTAAGFVVDYLFTEIAPGYGAHRWVGEFLRKHGYPTQLRGEQMFCLAHRVPDAPTERYPSFLYEV